MDTKRFVRRKLKNCPIGSEVRQPQGLIWCCVRRLHHDAAIVLLVPKNGPPGDRVPGSFWELLEDFYILDLESVPLAHVQNPIL